MSSNEMHPSKLVEEAILALEKATGLSKYEAKTVVYWAIATHGLEVLYCFPPLVLHGESGTGKSTILEFISGLVHARFLSTTSQAEFRDQLVKNRIVFIEEGDNVNEELILKRYSRQSGEVNIKRQIPGGFFPDSGNIYGATVLHRRYGFEDLALQSRTITIKTKKVKKQFHKIELIGEYKARLKGLWDDAWRRFCDYEVSGRTETNWKPLIIVALTLEDMEWINYAKTQQEIANGELQANGEFEPEKMLTFALDDLKTELNTRLVYLSMLIEHLNHNYMWKPSPKRVAKILREMGYIVKHHKRGFAVELP